MRLYKKGNKNMVTTIKFTKVREGAIIPSKEVENAGMDIYACFDEDYIIIPSHETKLISTGVCSAFDSDYVLVLKERSSTGTKGMGQRAGIIDSGYRGEWFIPITNHNNKPIVISKKGFDVEEEFSDNGAYGENYIIYPYEKAICQALLLPVPTTVVEEYTYEELQAIPSKRGKGALGSSGK